MKTIKTPGGDMITMDKVLSIYSTSKKKHRILFPNKLVHAVHLDCALGDKPEKWSFRSFHSANKADEFRDELIHICKDAGLCN